MTTFFSDFLLPLVAGGTVHVGAPLGSAGLARLRETKPPAQVVGGLLAARAAAAAELLLDPIPPSLDLEALRLAVAVHDLLFLFHPRAASISEKRLGEVAAWAASLAALPPSVDPDVLVARHTVLHRLHDLGRTDVRVSFWVGRREFHGEEPPRRLTAWKSVRRVREERWRVSCFAEAASHPLGGNVAHALLDGSPLTDLLHPVRLEPRLDLVRRRDLLAVPSLCRAVAYAWLDEGIDRVGGALAAATLGALDGTAPAAARLICALLAHLHLCALLGVPVTVEGGRMRLALAAGADQSLRDFYGLFAALHRTTPDLCAPPDVRRDPRLMKRVDEHAAACLVACGPTRVAELATLVARAGGPIALSATGGIAPVGTSDLR